MKNNIFVLCGGKSVEHEISLKSATAIINSIDRDKYNVYPVFIDHEGVFIPRGLWEAKIEDPSELVAESNKTVAESLADFLMEFNKLDRQIIFPALHGPNGEDGTPQGFLELLNVPYVGCGVLSSAVAMDKAIARDLFKVQGLPQTDYTYFLKYQWQEDREAIKKDILDKVGYPVYVKPSNSGSSVGISRVEDESSIEAAIDLALNYDEKVIVEKEVVAREMQVSVIGNDHPKVSVAAEFITEDSFFDYDSKYLNGTAKPVVPARLTEDTAARVRKLAVDSYKTLNCSGVTRVDIFVDDENNIFVNEANTMPGFTAVSMTPVLWEVTAGTSYTELVEELIQYAIDNFNKKQELVNKK